MKHRITRDAVSYVPKKVFLGLVTIEVINLVVLENGFVEVVRISFRIFVEDEGELEDAPVEVEDGRDAGADAVARQHRIVCDQR